MRNLFLESKFDSKRDLTDIMDICELNDCNRVLFFEARRKEDLYLWIANIGSSPTLKFYVSNSMEFYLIIIVHTMNELSFTGNSIHGICPILSFDSSFESSDNLKLVKDALTNVLS